MESSNDDNSKIMDLCFEWLNNNPPNNTNNTPNTPNNKPTYTYTYPNNTVKTENRNVKSEKTTTYDKSSELWWKRTTYSY